MTDRIDAFINSVRAIQGMELTSTAFDHDGRMPDRFGYTNENHNPPLKIGGVPDEAEELVLIMDDPDAMKPAGKVWDHWVLTGIDPEISEMGEGTALEGATQGRNSYGELGYGGPNPPDREHTYVFTLYALDTPLNIGEGATKTEVEAAMDGHVIEQAVLHGRFSPEQSS